MVKPDKPVTVEGALAAALEPEPLEQPLSAVELAADRARGLVSEAITVAEEKAEEVPEEPKLFVRDNAWYTAWALGLPLSVVNDKALPAIAGNDGKPVSQACSFGGDEVERCWGRVTPYDHPVAGAADFILPQNGPVTGKYTCRGHFWKMEGGPYVARPGSNS